MTKKEKKEEKASFAAVPGRMGDGLTDSSWERYRQCVEDFSHVLLESPCSACLVDRPRKFQQFHRPFAVCCIIGKGLASAEHYLVSDTFSFYWQGNVLLPPLADSWQVCLFFFVLACALPELKSTGSYLLPFGETRNESIYIGLPYSWKRTMTFFSIILVGEHDTPLR